MLGSTKHVRVARRDLLSWSVIAFLPAVGRSDALGRVYLYAQRSTPARSWIPVFCGAAEIAALKEGRFFVVTLPAGTYTFQTGNGVPRSIEVQPGAELFLRLDWSHQIGRPPIPAFSGVRATQARQEMRFLSYIESKYIRSGAVSPRRDPREPEKQQLKRRTDP